MNNSAFPVRSETNYRCPLSPFLFSTEFEVPASAIKQEKLDMPMLKNKIVFVFRGHDGLHRKFL